MKELAITYSRCSTSKQDLDSQNSKLLAWASKFEYKKHFEDFAISGKTTEREGIDSLLNFIRTISLGSYDKIYLGVIELSRIGRSIGFICSIVKELSDKGIPIVLVNTNTIIDYNTLEGSAMINALAMAADIEYRLIVDRNKRGREKIKSEGIKLGRKHKEVSNTAILALRDKGLSMGKIAKELGVSAPTILRRLRELES